MIQNLAREAQNKLKINQGVVDSLQVQNCKNVIEFLWFNSLCGKHVLHEENPQLVRVGYFIIQKTQLEFPWERRP